MMDNPLENSTRSRYGASIVSLPATGGVEQSMPTNVRAKQSLSPCVINRLPTELLCTIFMMCGDPNGLFAYPRDERMDPTSTSVRTLSYIQATVKLGRVCSLWFTVTRGTPQLWTVIDVALPQPCDVAALRLGLKHSQGVPLALRINDYMFTPSRLRNTKVCVQFMELVASSAHRWGEISIIMKYEPPTVCEMMAPLLELPEDSFVSLKRAMLRLHGGAWEGSPTVRLWTKFHASPTIREVQWYCQRFSAPPSLLHRLTHVGVNSIMAGEIMGLLQECPQLEVLRANVKPAPDKFPGLDDGRLFPKLPTPVMLLHLRTLILSGMYDWTNFFGGLTAPRLDQLQMCVAGIQASPLCAMLRRSSARLRTLAFRWLYHESNDDIAALLQSPEMDYLTCFCYDPYTELGEEPDPFDPSLYLPPRAIIYAKTLIRRGFKIAFLGVFSGVYALYTGSFIRTCRYHCGVVTVQRARRRYFTSVL
ncbi:uncharacterized protein SCHCODRAFT_02593878 [Schizophyllum commune H4-8]|uniref:uncharacterized protein n=1 Tax=Schizophyllum commune (strain H4-8 / FGSC 9210) TaxID=578458 RepID=UPI00215EB040|nr:uncharacterized protein SCHCODRAFT_02593878 [Schizophyllum commune H4-8]KAI5885370.1 hypothetical protein SCHCODRAFT_02593878 [Schizophyllum commune H4-8]